MWFYKKESFHHQRVLSSVCEEKKWFISQKIFLSIPVRTPDFSPTKGRITAVSLIALDSNYSKSQADCISSHHNHGYTIYIERFMF